jgi:GAF domain-containing protein
MTGDSADADRGQPSSDYSGGSAADDLAHTLGELARALQDEVALEATLDALVAAAVGTIPGTRYAALTVVRGRAVQTRAASDDLVRRVDEVQYESGQGPCLDSAYKQRTVRVADLAHDDRWPQFAARAVRMGVRSMLSIQMYVAHDNLGALNLYSPEVDAFGDESEQVGLLFATHAAVAMADAQHRYDMDRAL